MDFEKVLAELHEQLRNLDSAIESLERLQDTGSRQRARSANGSGPQKETRKPVSYPADKKRA
jgi:hypothetical protein